MKILGFSITEKQVKIKDYDPSYEGKKPNENCRAPIMVSNHVSHIDIPFFVAQYCASFLSKAGVKKAPLLGFLTQSIQSVFVNREDRDDKNIVLAKIKLRVQNIVEKKQNFPPLLIFPEGTTTNGNQLIKFKIGAFFTISPIQMICLKYNYEKFNHSMTGMDDKYIVLFSLFFIRQQLTVYIFDEFYPDYLKLDKNNPDHQIIYQNKIESIMAKCLNQQVINTGYSSKKEYMDQVEKILSKINNTKNE